MIERLLFNDFISWLTFKYVNRWHVDIFELVHTPGHGKHLQGIACLHWVLALSPACRCDLWPPESNSEPQYSAPSSQPRADSQPLSLGQRFFLFSRRISYCTVGWGEAVRGYHEGPASNQDHIESLQIDVSVSESESYMIYLWILIGLFWVGKPGGNLYPSFNIFLY